MVTLRSWMILFLVGAGVMVTAMACSNEAPTPARHGAPRKQSPTAASTADSYPMIVRIVGRHQSITVTAGPSGPLYTAATSDGKVLVASATLDQLRDQYPDVYQQLNPMTALKDGAGDGRDGESRESAPNGESASSAAGARPMPVMLMSSRAD